MTKEIGKIFFNIFFFFTDYFKKKKIIGKGGFSIIHQGIRRADNKDFAIKSYSKNYFKNKIIDKK